MKSLINVDARGHIHKSATPEERLMHHGWTLADSGCWEWAGNTKHKFGYGQLRILGKGREAHSVAYEVWVGPIPEGMQVRHTCDNPPCINPAHLILGTSQDNHNDMVSRGRALNGERNPAVKLTAEQVANIKNEVRAGATHTETAQKYGVTQSHVTNIVNGKTRKVG